MRSILLRARVSGAAVVDEVVDATTAMPIFGFIVVFTYVVMAISVTSVCMFESGCSARRTRQGVRDGAGPQVCTDAQQQPAPPYGEGSFPLRSLLSLFPLAPVSSIRHIIAPSLKKHSTRWLPW